MKKIVLFTAVILGIGVLSACKSHEKCPAYGKVDTQSVKAKA